MTDRLPTTEVVKDAACFPRDRLGEPRAIDRDAFDTWLARERARWQTEALRDAATDLEAQLGDSGPGNRNTGYGRAALDLLRQIRDRANQIEREWTDD